MTKGPVTSQSWIVEAVLFIQNLAFGLCWFAFTPLQTPIAEAFHLSSAENGALISIVNLATAFTPLLTGLWARRVGLRTPVLLASFFMLSALLFSYASDYQMLLVFRFVFGVGGGMWAALLGATMMEVFTSNYYDALNGLNGISINVGIVFALMMTPALMEYYSWQEIVLGYGGVHAICFVVLWAVRSCLPSGYGKKEEEQAAKSWTSVLLRPYVLWMAFAFTGSNIVYMALYTWLPKYLQELGYVTLEQGQAWTGWITLIGIFVSVAAGFVQQKFQTFATNSIAIAGGFLSFSLLSLWFASSKLQVLMSIVGLGIGFFLYLPRFFSLPMIDKTNTTGDVSLILGSIFSLASLVAGPVPLLVGLWLDYQGSLRLPMAVIGLCSWMVFIGGVALARLSGKTLGPVDK